MYLTKRHSALHRNVETPNRRVHTSEDGNELDTSLKSKVSKVAKHGEERVKVKIQVM